MLFETESSDQTIDLGRRIGRALPKRAVVLLIGNLGAGKTTIAKGILEGLGVAVPDEVTSPTFTLIHEYADGRAYHIDLYRLDRAEQVETLGLDELLDRESVLLIEWGERFPELWPADRVEIRIAPGTDSDDQRRFTVIPELGLAAGPLR